MNKAIKKLWVAALRSGEYKQGEGQLRVATETGTSFCCLGVLCNLHAQAHPEIAAMNDNPEMYMGEADVLPAAVIKWAGVKLQSGDYVIIDNHYERLSHHNDIGRTFAEIADAIESQL